MGDRPLGKETLHPGGDDQQGRNPEGKRELAAGALLQKVGDFVGADQRGPENQQHGGEAVQIGKKVDVAEYGGNPD